MTAVTRAAKSTLLAVAAILALFAGAAPAQLTETDYVGRSVTLQQPARRIVASRCVFFSMILWAALTGNGSSPINIGTWKYDYSTRFEPVQTTGWHEVLNGSWVYRG